MPRFDSLRQARLGRALTYAAVGVLTAASLAMCALALTKNSSDAAARAASTYTPPTLPTGAPASDSATPSPTPGAPVAVFLGDSYVAGDGASDPADAFPALVAAHEGWQAQVVACPGAGYATAGDCGENLSGLVPTVVADAPDIVVVSAGRYDMSDAADVSAGADAVFSSLHSALPDAQIYVVSPVWDDDHAVQPLGYIQQDVKDAAERNGATYLDIGEPLRDHPELVASDGVMPDDDGHAALADAIEKALPGESEQQGE
ncbi:SGNH/GDSL hydrolase family protein [Gryllotalpicola ginsengisoli]|uniref:SGNH/GDSL hydrolase family protein n=1 Tax=Gryllotalpicola ginsengisoli TaxID=444608 RepID=UPI0003B562FB|nr:SGNH/GDSL hydrolase family protein [Gryllotalpicola ginsengisoli]